MKKYLVILMSLLIPLHFSCSTKIESNSKGIIHIDIESNIENFRPLKLSEIASNIEYIPLESRSGFLFKMIKNVIILDNYILVQGYNKIGLFDRNGTFITEVGKKGKGPGQYTIAGVSYILDDLIYVPEVIGRSSIYIYDLTGKFIKAYPYPKGFISSAHHNWLPISQNELLLQVPNHFGDQEFRIVKIDTLGTILSGYPNSTRFIPFYNKRYSTDSQAGYFYLFDNKIRYKEIRNDTIWEISDEKLMVRYIVDRGKFGLNFDFRTTARSRPNKDEIRISKVFETGKFMFFETKLARFYPFKFYMEYNPIIGRNRPFDILGIYNKEIGDTYFVKPSNLDDSEFPPGIPTGIQNDIDGGINFFPKKSVSDSVVVSWIEAYKLIEYAASEAFKKNKPKNMEQKKEFTELANNRTLNDNPVLIVIKLTQ